MILIIAAFVALTSLATKAEAYACNNRHYVNSSGHVVHSPSCGREHLHRENTFTASDLARRQRVVFRAPSRDLFAPSWRSALGMTRLLVGQHGAAAGSMGGTAALSLADEDA